MEGRLLLLGCTEAASNIKDTHVLSQFQVLHHRLCLNLAEKKPGMERNSKRWPDDTQHFLPDQEAQMLQQQNTSAAAQVHLTFTHLLLSVYGDLRMCANSTTPFYAAVPGLLAVGVAGNEGPALL